MTNLVNRRITLASRPEGAPKDSDFKLIEAAVPEPGPGQMLCRTIYLSLDPYMRGRMNAGKSYAAPVEIGEPMVGGTVGQIVSSNIEKFMPGDYVQCYNGWQDYALCDGTGVRKLDPQQAPISTAVGVLGMPGMTAYTGLLELGKPQSGETLVVSAASGAVGAVVGQIAKIKGCRVVGVAGVQSKCDYVVQELGFDACVSYRAEDFADQLHAACPDGIDIYYENVGGQVLETVIPLLNFGARIPVCGLIAHYNATELPPGPNRLPQLMRVVLTQRVTIRGFIVTDFAHRHADFINDMSSWIKQGKIKYREDIVEGLENAVSAFQGLLQGKNFGKLLIRVSDDPTR
jgi:NADPH-dependent curcumin reductase CurA